MFIISQFQEFGNNIEGFLLLFGWLLSERSCLVLSQVPHSVGQNTGQGCSHLKARPGLEGLCPRKGSKVHGRLVWLLMRALGPLPHGPLHRAA